MKIKGKIQLGVSLFAMTFSFETAADETCKTVPTCDSLGYTATSCSGDSLKCPYDTSKMYCVIIPHPCNSSETQVGDIYYSDDTCSSEAISSKTPIGVVCDTERKLVISLENATTPWNDGEATYKKITGLRSYSSSAALQDFNGKYNTDAIVAFAASSGQAHEAAQYCHDMTTGGKTWYLPALGEMMAIGTNYSTVNASLSKVGTKFPTKDTYHWSSTEYLNDTARICSFYFREQGTRKKNYSNDTRCVFTY